MRLATVFRPFGDAAVIEDRVTDQMRAEHEAEVQEARLAYARRHWAELEELDLVPRGRELLVSATTDEVFRASRGVIFEPGTASPITDHASLWFHVRDSAGELAILEREPTGTPPTTTVRGAVEMAPCTPVAWTLSAQTILALTATGTAWVAKTADGPLEARRDKR